MDTTLVRRTNNQKIINSTLNYIKTGSDLKEFGCHCESIKTQRELRISKKILTCYDSVRGEYLLCHGCQFVGISESESGTFIGWDY